MALKNYKVSFSKSRFLNDFSEVLISAANIGDALYIFKKQYPNSYVDSIFMEEWYG